MKTSVTSAWRGKMAFEAEINGHKLVMDASEENGGDNSGPRPKLLLLSALAGCTGMDVVSILQKMRVQFDDLKIKVEGDITEEHPKQFEKMHIIYEFTGKDLPKDKLEKAISLSQEKYCGVSATFRKAMAVTFELKIID